MVKWLKNILFERLFYQTRSRWFLNALYIFLFCKGAFWLVTLNTYFGNDALIYRSMSPVPVYWRPVFILYSNPAIHVALVFSVALLILSFLALLLKRSYWFIHVLLWLILLNIHQAVYTGLSGGEYLLQVMVITSLFMQKAPDGTAGSVPGILHNLSAIGLTGQICFMYVAAGVSKVVYPEWREGSALGMIMTEPAFNLWQMPVSLFWLWQVLNYSILIYQIGFPFLAFSRRYAVVFLWFGVLMHVFIIFNMGLITFGLSALLPYLLWLKGIPRIFPKSGAA